MRIWNFKYPYLKTSVTSEPNEMNFLSIVSGNTLRIPTASIYNNHDAIIIIISTSQIAPASDPLPKTPPSPIQRDHLPLRLHDQSNMHPRTLHRLQRNDRQTRLARNDGGSSQLLPCGGWLYVSYQVDGVGEECSRTTWKAVGWCVWVGGKGWWRLWCSEEYTCDIGGYERWETDCSALYSLCCTCHVSCNTHYLASSSITVASLNQGRRYAPNHCREM